LFQGRWCVRLKRLIIRAFWFETTTARFLNNFSETQSKPAVSSLSAGNSERWFKAGAVTTLKPVTPIS
jgi:hypothetical protein